MLKTYTISSTASRINWLHWVVSRKKTRRSFMMNSRRVTGRNRRAPATHRCHRRPAACFSAPSWALEKAAG